MLNYRQMMDSSQCDDSNIYSAIANYHLPVSTTRKSTINKFSARKLLAVS